MNAKLKLQSAKIDIPVFMEVLEWLQKCPVKELEIYVESFYLQKQRRAES